LQNKKNKDDDDDDSNGSDSGSASRGNWWKGQKVLLFGCPLAKAITKETKNNNPSKTHFNYSF